MVYKDQVDYERLNKKLHQLNDEKVNNALALSTHEQFEQEIHEIDKKERNIWNRLSECWGEDREFVLSLEHIRIELDQNRRHVSNHMENQKRALIRKKRDLYYSEDRLNDLKRLFR